MRQHARCATVLLATLLLATAVTGQTRKSRAHIVDGERVLVGPAARTKPLLDVTDVKIYGCTIQRTGAPSTVVSGYITSYLPHENYVVTVTVRIAQIVQRTSRLFATGAAKATVVRPLPGKRVRFTALGPRFHLLGDAAHEATAVTHVTAEFTAYDPAKHDPTHLRQP